MAEAEVETETEVEAEVEAEVEQLTVLERVAKAREQFQALTGVEPAAVAGVSKVDGGWELSIDVVEVARIPETASLMATYRVTTDDAGDVTGYERARRFNRSEAG